MLAKNRDNWFVDQWFLNYNQHEAGGYLERPN